MTLRRWSPKCHCWHWSTLLPRILRIQENPNLIIAARMLRVISAQNINITMLPLGVNSITSKINYKNFSVISPLSKAIDILLWRKILQVNLLDLKMMYLKTCQFQSLVTCLGKLTRAKGFTLARDQVTKSTHASNPLAHWSAWYDYRRRLILINEIVYW